MRVFEFHFNPNLKPDEIFDSFCYEPENIYEKRMGSLYLAGLLKNVLPQNIHFLDKLQKVIQKEYYRSTIRKPEKALKESLKEANEFLEQIAKKGDVSWLGNLSFAVLSLKNYELNFTKIDEIKIFLLRGRKIIDIDRKIKYEEITPWPLKIFGNIVSGKLAEGDVLLVSTKEITDFLERENLLAEIGKIWPLDEKKLREIFDKRKEEVLKISGLSLFIFLTKEVLSGKKEIITPQSYPKEFNLFAELHSSLSLCFAWLKEFFALYLKKIAVLFTGFSRLPKFIKPSKLEQLPKVAIPKFPNLTRRLFDKLNKTIVLVLALIFFLALGFFIGRVQEEKELKKHQITLAEIQEKVNRAESFLILKTPAAEKEANLLLKESWEEISHLSKIIFNLPKDFQNKVFSLKEDISKSLSELNKSEIIEEPELFFEFKQREFGPQKIVLFKEDFYFFSPYSQNIFKVNKIGEGKIIETNQKFAFGTITNDLILFFAKPNQIFILKPEGFLQFQLQQPELGFDFEDFALFKENLYFLDKKNGQIIKYPYLGNLKWGSPQFWLAKEEKVTEAKSLAVDSSIWVLNKNNSLNRYHLGRLQEEFKLEIFPEVKEFKKIFASPALPYLYLLEPSQKRIVIIDKKGQIIKQLQSQKFDNLLDFTISEDGKEIYLLNGSKVYQIKFPSE